ncbi:hypothetical protein NDU88_002122 [Pleurodeles waltl]|uniref:Transposase n=1 Tax=Pleurodeles waltl TaxID=8319 RepID=A0AAV7SEH7_PLEWA|nr:hypothetical protein NDU88_002122 [Pleurodeles waltl]
MCADSGKGKTLQARSSGAARILCFLRRLLHWLHCCGVHTFWRLNVRRMQPKGAKAAFSARRGNQLRISTTPRQGAAIETIYQSIIEHREESKIESRRTQLACRKMQTQIRRVAKTCSEFTARMKVAETRISRLEDDIGSQKMTQETMEKQLEDTQWKLTDLEDRLRRNNLRVLGIPEGAEGSDPRGFMVALFKEAFLDLHQWEWEREIQRAHRFPFNRAGEIELASEKIRLFLYVAMAIFRLCITTDWIKEEPSTFEVWRSRLLAIYNIELSLYKLKGHKKRHRGERIWAPLTKWLENQCI